MSTCLKSLLKLVLPIRDTARILLLPSLSSICWDFLPSVLRYRLPLQGAPHHVKSSIKSCSSLFYQSDMLLVSLSYAPCPIPLLGSSFSICWPKPSPEINTRIHARFGPSFNRRAQPEPEPHPD
jgi:hypothetical protein